MLEHTIKMLRFANYLLIALIALSILLLTRTIISTSFTKSTDSSAMTIVSNKSSNKLMKTSLTHYAEILEKNAFGPSLKLRSLSATGKTEPAPTSLTGLVLIGTVVESKKSGFAIFRDNTGASAGTEDFFYLGDNVFNYGKLIKVDSNSVEIIQNGQTHTLSIPYEKMTEPHRATQKPAAKKSKSSFARKISDKEYVLDSKRVQESIENPERILTDARLLPNFVDGKQEGFSISEVVSDGLYHSLGLKNGDVLLKVNGLEISNPEVAIQAMSALKGMNRVNLDIVRSGKNMSMSYQLR
jgi:general secretion pathway protein C